MNLTFLQTMTRTTGANAIWLQCTAIFWVTLAAAAAMGERLALRDLIVTALGVSGIVIIVFFELRSSPRTTDHAGVYWGLAAGVAYAAVILNARAMRDLDAAWMMTVNHLATALLLFPLTIRFGIRPDLSQVPWLAGFGALQMAFPYVLFTRGLRSVPVHEASLIALLEPLILPLWIYLAWHDHPSYQSPAWWTWVGAAAIFSGLVLKYTRIARNPGAAK
jgi:drug/metabolite transporter (DMT)-like permease